MSDFTQIQTFIEVAKLLNFAQASRRLSLPTSTVSARIKALETRLNVRLLNRNTRSVTLTDEGEIYLLRCQQTLEKLLDIEDSLNQKKALSGQIKVTIPVHFPLTPFTKILSDFTELHENVTFDILATDDPLDLITNNIDIALRGRLPGAASLVSRKLGEGKCRFFVSPHYYGNRLMGDRGNILNDHYVLDPVDFLSSLARFEKADPGQIKTQDFALVKELALQSKGIALLPENLCQDALRDGTLRIVDFGLQLPALPLYIVFPSREYLPARVRAFIDFLVLSQKSHPLI